MTPGKPHQVHSREEPCHNHRFILKSFDASTNIFTCRRIARRVEILHTSMSAIIQSESSATDPYVHTHPYYFFFPVKPADNKSSRAASSFAVVFFRTTGMFDALLDAASSSFCFNSAFFATLAARAAESLRFLLAGFPSCDERFVEKDIHCETTTRKNLDH